jgi:hypothetical protein
VKWPLYRIRPRQQNPASREVTQDHGIPERIRKKLALPEPNGRVPDLRGLNVGSHRLPGLQTGLGLRTEPRSLSGTKLRIER